MWRRICSLLLILTLLVPIPVSASDSFAGWDEENKMSVYDVYAVTNWAQYEGMIDVTHPENRVAANGVHKDVRKLENTVETLLKNHSEELQYESSKYTELILAMIEVLGYQEKAKKLPKPDVCNYGRFVDTSVAAEIQNPTDSISYLIQRFIIVENIYARYYNYSIYKMDDSLKGLIQSVIYGPIYAGSTYAGKYTKEKSREYKEQNKETLKGNKEGVISTFAEQVASYYTASMYVDGGTSDIIGEAKKYVGNKYVFGGNSLTNGIDCSHFVWQILKRTGHYSGPWHQSTSWKNVGTKVNSMEEAQPGDVLVYNGHVVFYMGGTKIIHASNSRPYPKGGIKVTNFSSVNKIKSYHGGLVAIRRF